ncbi:MAG: hypothetical protein ACLRYB_15085 [Segatella copri]
MANKMSLCIIKYTYTQYVGVDIEKYTRGLFEYVKEAFGEFQPQMSEPGTIPDMPDYLDIVLCKKDGSIFYEMDIQRRAINIPLDFQAGRIGPGNQYHQLRWYKIQEDTPILKINIL